MAKKKNNNNNSTPKETPQEPKTEEKKEAVVFIGNKPMKAYLLACLHFFDSGEKKVVLKARGRAISRCVDVAEVVKRTNTKVSIGSISLGTEVMEKDNIKRNVSTMEIELLLQ